MNSYTEKVLASVHEKNSHEKEFIQAVDEVLKSIAPMVEKNWKRRNISSNLILKNKKDINSNKKSIVSFSNLGEVLAESITSSISTILLIGGFVVIFSSIILYLSFSIFSLYSFVFLCPIFNNSLVKFHIRDFFFFVCIYVLINLFGYCF